jgi:hypothetical protein
MKRGVIGVILTTLCATAWLGCLGDEGPPNPVPIEPPEIPERVESGEVRRTVETRNPLGGRLGNLLVDGDFELSIIVQGTGAQSGWLAFGNQSAYLRGATGGVCRRGLRCGWADPSVLLFAQGAAAKDSGMIATLWAKPPEGSSCSMIRAEILRCSSFDTAAPLFQESPEPRPDGWCFYRGRISRQTTAVCMLVQNVSTTESVLVDDAAIVPDTGTTPLSSANEIPDSKFQPLHGEHAERVRALIKWRRNRMKIGAPHQGRPNIGLK